MIKRNTIQLVFVALLFLILGSCDQTILRDDCESLNDIQLQINSKFFTECDPQDTLIARGASITIISGKDTLMSGNFNSNGVFETGPIENSSCGLNNVKIEASYSGETVSEEFGLLCCDTTLTYVFKNITCEPPAKVNCASIDSTINKTITSSGECVLINAPYSELKNNVVILSSNSPVRIDLSGLDNMNGKIVVERILPANTGNFIELDSSQVEIYFNVERSAVDTIVPVTVTLPTSCLDANGNEISQGTITIVLDATICDPTECFCPFGENDNTEDYYAQHNVATGESETFIHKILELPEGRFGEGCILKIDSIKRADGTSAYTPGNHAWTLASGTLPQLTVGEYLEISAAFAPATPDEFTDEFEVFTSVYSEANPTVKKNNSECSFRFKLIGKGCEEACPTIQILAPNVKMINLSTLQERSVPILTTETFNNSEAIWQKVQSTMTTDCLNDLDMPGLAVFNIKLPDGNYCSDIELTSEKKQLGATDDTNFFYPIFTKKTLGDDDKSSVLSITFLPPTLTDFYSKPHGNSYQCSFTVKATDANGTTLCQQVIQLEAEVKEFSLGSRIEFTMGAFSQKTSSSSVPSYHVFDIDQYNTKLKNYGLLEALTASFIDFSSVPNKPISEHSLYFDVDSPENEATNLSQKPELYLINTPENNFSRISSLPIASYNTHDKFIEAYESGSLMQTIMNLNTGNLTNFNLSNSFDKNSFTGTNGIVLQPYGVYVIWDPNSSPDSFATDNGQKHIFCGMALLYVSSVKSGADNNVPGTGGQGKATVSFYVEYPLQFEE